MVQRKRTKFLIFGQGRTGSTLLKQLLNSHLDINCEGELLNKKDNYVTNPLYVKLVNKFPLEFFSLRERLSLSSVYGFTLLHYQLPNPFESLRKMQEKGWKIIHISRNNSLNQSFSHLVAKQTNIWHRKQNQANQIPAIYIDPSDLFSWIERLLINKNREIEFFSKINHEKVVYENDLCDENQWIKTTERLFAFLEVEKKPAYADLKTTYTRPYSEIIENYEELIKELKNSKFSTILNEFL